MAVPNSGKLASGCSGAGGSPGRRPVGLAAGSVIYGDLEHGPVVMPGTLNTRAGAQPFSTPDLVPVLVVPTSAYDRVITTILFGIGQLIIDVISGGPQPVEQATRTEL